MSPPQANTLSFDSGNAPEFTIKFRFSISWSSLLSVVPAQVHEPPVSRVPVVFTAPVPTESAPKLSESTARPPARSPARSNDQWEMVIPKMARPAAKPAPARLQPPAAPPAAPRRETAAAPIPVTFEPNGPALYTLSGSLWSRASLVWKLVIIAGVGLLSTGAWLWVRSEPPKPAPRVQLQTAAGENLWIRHNAYRAGAREGRQLLLYGPSQEESDYRLEFAWTPDPKGVGLIYRSSDNGSYYVTKLRLEPSRLSTMIAEHFAVVSGVEGKHVQRLLATPRTASAIHVRIDASGPAFTLYVQDTPVDQWNDPRLTTGGIGFFEERQQHASIQTVRFTFFKKGASKTMMIPVQ